MRKAYMYKATDKKIQGSIPAAGFENIFQNFAFSLILFDSKSWCMRIYWGTRMLRLVFLSLGVARSPDASALESQSM